MSDTTISLARGWDAVAPAWDRHVDDIDDDSAAATQAMIDRLDVRAGDRLVELGAGPGSLGAEWSRRVGPDGAVVLSDVAPAMVEVAARRNARYANVTCRVLDASAMDQADDSFDVVASRMSLMFTTDPAATFAEIHRVLAPGGRFGAQTWGAMEHNPWMTCVGLSAMINGLVAGAPPVGPGGIFSLADPATVQSLTAAAGFEDVSVEEFTVVFSAPDVDAHIERVLSLAGPLSVAFRSAPPEQAAAVRKTAAEIAAPYVTSTGVELPGRVVLVTARA